METQGFTLMVLAMRCWRLALDMSHRTLVYAMRLLPQALSQFVCNVLCVFTFSQVDPEIEPPFLVSKTKFNFKFFVYFSPSNIMTCCIIPPGQEVHTTTPTGKIIVISPNIETYVSFPPAVPDSPASTSQSPRYARSLLLLSDAQ